MTMPSKIYVGHNGYGTYWQTNVSDTDTPYIRADLAEELARAASVSLAYYFEESGEYIDGMTELLAELTAYRAITA